MSNLKNHEANKDAVLNALDKVGSARDIPMDIQHRYLQSHLEMIPSSAGLGILSREKLTDYTHESLKENGHLRNHFNEIMTHYDKNPEHYNNEKHKLFFNAFRQDFMNDAEPNNFKVSNWSSHKVTHI